MWDWISAFVDLVLPPVCVLCGKGLVDQRSPSELRWAGQGLCERCALTIPWLGPPCCPTCAKPIPAAVETSHPCGDCLLEPPMFDSARALLIYEEEIFPIVHKMKYGPRPSLASFFGELMARAWAEDLEKLGPDGILPIPLPRKRLRRRGFNQASLMGRRLEKGLGIPLCEGLLERKHWTHPQVGLSRSERESNIRGAFGVRDASRIRGGSWILLDDVYTTGATLREATRVLRRAGAKKVHIVTLARVL